MKSYKTTVILECIRIKQAKLIKFYNQKFKIKVVEENIRGLSSYRVVTL